MDDHTGFADLGPEDSEERRKFFESPAFDWYKQRPGTRYRPHVLKTFWVQDGSRPRYLSKCELEGSVNTTSRQLDAVYFPSCMCLLYTTKLDQSQQVLSEAMIHDEDPTWVAIVW